jgi:hypothetical protein
MVQIKKGVYLISICKNKKGILKRKARSSSPSRSRSIFTPPLLPLSLPLPPLSNCHSGRFLSPFFSTYYHTTPHRLAVVAELRRFISAVKKQPMA